MIDTKSQTKPSNPVVTALQNALDACLCASIQATDRQIGTFSYSGDLQDAARSMTGPKCFALAAALRQMEPKAANLKVVGIVRSVSKRDSSFQIEWGGKLFLAGKEELRGSVSIGDWVQFVPRRGNRVGSFLAKEVWPTELSSAVKPIDNIKDSYS